jgi:hypothetical protein
MATPMFAPTNAAPSANPINSQVKLDSGFGNVPEVQQAWMSRLQPQMDQQRQAEISRLKSQGITENSDVWGRSMDTLNRNQVDANNQGLLYGTQENNNIFNRGLAQNNQVFGQNQNAQQLALALRGQQASEAAQAGNLNLAQRQQMMAEQNQPYQQLGYLNSMMPGNPQFGNVGTGTNYTGAGTSDYLSQLGNYNAKTAANNGMISGIGQIAGGVGNAAINNQGGLGGLLSGIGNIFGGWGKP